MSLELEAANPSEHAQARQAGRDRALAQEVECATATTGQRRIPVSTTEKKLTGRIARASFGEKT